MQKNASQAPSTWKNFYQARESLEHSDRRTTEPSSPRPLSNQPTMDSDFRQNRPHSHRLSVGNVPQDEPSPYSRTIPPQYPTHSRSSSGNIYSTSGGGSPVSFGTAVNRVGGSLQREGASGGSDSNSSSNGQGTGEPRVMDSERGRLNQLMTNFFLKLALLVIRSRMDVPPVFTRGTANRKTNKWFNVELEETDIFKEDLRLWKYSDATDNRPPPLIIETYLEAEELTPNQTLIILDEQDKRHNVEATLSAFRNWRRGSPLNSKKEVVLERWRVDLSSPAGDINPELAVVYKKSIVLFRSLFAYARLLPAWKLQKKLSKSGKNISGLRLGCRIINGENYPTSRPDPLDIALIPREQNVTNGFQFGSVESPAGVFTVKVEYRKNCDFRVDDSEALLSSHFLNLDEHYFKPPLHQRTGSQPTNLISREPGSLPANAAVTAQRGDPGIAYGSLSSFHQIAGLSSQSPISALRNVHMSGGSSTGSPSDAASLPLRSIQGSKASLRSVESVSGVQRRPSVSFMQPFKTPSLSASPSTDFYGPSPRTSLQRIPQTGLPSPVRQRPSTGTMSPSSLKSAIPIEGAASVSAQDATPVRPASINRYSSSFADRRHRQSSGASKTEDDNNSSGKGSVASSSAAPGSGMLVEGALSTAMNEEDKSLKDFMSMLDQRQPLKIFDSFSESSGRRTVAALGKYQKMRDSNAALHDSMSSSLLLASQPSSSLSPSGRNQASNPPALSGASVSTSSSPGKAVSPHTPAIPSRLIQNETIVHDHPSGNNESGSLDEIVSRMSPTQFNFRTGRTQGETNSLLPTTTYTTATTSPMNIPSSPRFVQVRRSNSLSHDHPEEEGSTGFQPLRRAPGSDERHSTSLDSMDRPPPFLLVDDNLTTATSRLNIGSTESRRQAPSATSLGDESPSDSRLASRTTSTDRVPVSAFGNRQPFQRSSPAARPPMGRTPSENRAMFPIDDDLLFDFSDRDMAQRRSLERQRGSSSRGDGRGRGTL